MIKWAFKSELGHMPSLTTEEILAPEKYYEGAMKKVAVNVYERDKQARTKCIEHYGAVCVVCNFDFHNVYGSLGTGFIHVHHLKPLSEIKKGYSVDPIADLRPVCPNCHAMIHRVSPALDVAVLRKAIGR
ncbi:MAG: restriction endonuclease [Proteobacteria bacterium]|nr:MAG: restriction endonuclease [Pseudomonadota bacterium]